MLKPSWALIDYLVRIHQFIINIQILPFDKFYDTTQARALLFFPQPSGCEHHPSVEIAILKCAPIQWTEHQLYLYETLTNKMLTLYI